MKKIKKYLKWLYGFAFIIAGLIIMPLLSFIGGLFFAVTGLLLLPYTFDLINKKASGKLTRSYKYALCLGSFFIGIILIANVATDRQIEKDRQEKLAFDKLPQPTKDSINHANKIAAEQEKETKEKTDRKELIESQFSDWDGSHVALTKYIKDNMNDADSYEHIETKFADKGDYILVQTKFRGANAFGAKVINYITAKVNFEGNVIEIVK